MPARSSRFGGSRAALVAVCALTLLALVLRRPGLHQALYGDELFTYDIVTRTGLGDLLAKVRDTSITPPLHYLIAYASQRLGNPPVAVRVPSLLAGAATVPLVYLLGMRTVGRRAALYATAFVAISPFLVFYGSEARAYALLGLLLVLCTLALVLALGGGAPSWWWAVFVLTGVAALYAHYTAVFYLGAQAIWAFVVYAERRRALLVAYGLIAVAFLPWIPAYLDQRHNPGMQAVANDFPGGFGPGLEGYATRVLRALSGSPFRGLEVLPGVPALVAMGVAVLAAAGLTLAQGGRIAPGGARVRIPPARVERDSGGRDGVRAPLVLLALLAASLPVGLVLYRLGGTNLFNPRNLIPSVPAMLLLLGALFARVRGPAGLAVVALFTAGLGVGTARILGDGARRPPWNLAARWLDRNVGPTDSVVQYDPVALLGKRPALFYGMIVFFDRRHPWFVPGIIPGTWKQAVRSRRVAVVYATVPGVPPLDPRPPRGGPWRLERTARWRGLNDVVVATWVRSGRSRVAAQGCGSVGLRDHRLLATPRAPCSYIVPVR